MKKIAMILTILVGIFLIPNLSNAFHLFIVDPEKNNFHAYEFKASNDCWPTLAVRHTEDCRKWKGEGSRGCGWHVYNKHGMQVNRIITWVPYRIAGDIEEKRFYNIYDEIVRPGLKGEHPLLRSLQCDVSWKRSISNHTHFLLTFDQLSQDESWAHKKDGWFESYHAGKGKLYAINYSSDIFVFYGMHHMMEKDVHDPDELIKRLPKTLLATFTVHDPVKVKKSIPKKVAESSEPLISKLKEILRKLLTFSEGKSYIEYKVKKGDTLSEISKKTTGDARNWKALKFYNRKHNTNVFDEDLEVGEIVYIPKKLIMKPNF